ncbi:hypothetical protein EDB81DRAFT_890698 [Dactylonectria macrodidyma]|uniref:Uncharacterized protein n=1 Tax=Dactylonectria macrodidyma TaxID=307937 RepID=A0A9P9DPH7_9HYPO|nr:hypothetical protein EDB81DRAFT_890698 [Dactylonectria macrodidyma]
MGAVAAVAAEYLGWMWYFWMGAIMELMLTATGFLSIPSKLGDKDADARMDWWGLCTIVTGLALVVFARQMEVMHLQVGVPCTFTSPLSLEPSFLVLTYMWNDGSQYSHFCQLSSSGPSE